MIYILKKRFVSCLAYKGYWQLLVLVGACIFLAGCQNPWKDFYQSYGALPEEAPYNGQPVCIPVQDFDTTVKEYLRDDFIYIGGTAFNAGGNVSLQNLQTFGESIKADVILYSIGNRTQTQSAMVVPQYNPGTQQTTYVNGYSASGGSFYGSANTYNSGTYSSSVVPVTIVRQDYSAVFLKKNWVKRILGMHVRPLTPIEAVKVGTNNAAYVDIVVRGTPAFNADFFEGDIVLEAGGKAPLEFWNSIESRKGQDVQIVILRNGSKITKQVKIGSGK